jgi:hypothetical protein
MTTMSNCASSYGQVWLPSMFCTSISAPTFLPTASAFFASVESRAATAALPLKPTLAARPDNSARSRQPIWRKRSPMRTPVIDTCSGSISRVRFRISIRSRNIMPTS